MDLSETQAYAAFLGTRREELLERIAQAAKRAGREPSEVTLLAVSKTVDVPQVLAACEVGYEVFGENRPQELVRKVNALRGSKNVRFDMIGNLQTNKINKVLGHATLVHSVTSLHLAEAISSRAAARGVSVQCLLEVNVSGEESKSGMSVSEAELCVSKIGDLPNVVVEGLMTMAPAGKAGEARRAFAGLRELRDELRAKVGMELPVLSCGMSDDFEIAIEEGSTLVRLGRVVFDPSYGDAGQLR
ncbi:MAG: YggS family pyridoxal phosphate-dependent enzyme [Atopobiaceae bacterium]|nr:YggS family pyridoxal phosphate-dependent enzyme [Atopobiaceae bacterium]